MSASAAEARLETLVRDAVAAFQPGFAIRLWSGARLGPLTGPVLVLRDATALSRLAFRPSIDTLVELWMGGTIDIEDGSIFDIAAATGAVRSKDGLKRLPKWRMAQALPALLRLRRAASKAASAEVGADAGASGSTKAAIQFHYDVSNRFYETFLDERMVYSCAYFDGWHDDIAKAQRDKLDMICRKLRLQPGERFLDIGCGWGALLIHAASHYGVTGHGVTLSQAQFDLATARVREAGLADKVTIELKPFQELTGQFDKIASIGMFEHVGFAHHDAYFGAVKRLLRTRGLYLHHTIARPAKKTLKSFLKGSREYRALTRYIFPGGELDYIGHSLQKLEANRFEVHDVENWREHYGRTCRLWAERLRANFPAAIAEVGEPRARLWLLYLAGCALAFERGTVMINQTLASKRDKGPSGLPPTRADLYR
ncbi:cyclopropane-fatty-acyl-phospholipid synthase family protein [Aureimonas sp. AU12]|uniref:SAM-dependent methyltransferase n=1 Tax=Aureimonas sp. AU12 TaxID=1638161 RepID=UPI0007824B97|nr:cyclopropane-fatty-acyl-phospholipid synthase family protein [Aureimonas sp. AU12]